MRCDWSGAAFGSRDPARDSSMMALDGLALWDLVRDARPARLFRRGRENRQMNGALR
jgi:hypothetical protein